jgi:hypothetical protein
VTELESRNVLALFQKTMLKFSKACQLIYEVLHFLILAITHPKVHANSIPPSISSIKRASKIQLLRPTINLKDLQPLSLKNQKQNQLLHQLRRTPRRRSRPSAPKRRRHCKATSRSSQKPIIQLTRILRQKKSKKTLIYHHLFNLLFCVSFITYHPKFILKDYSQFFKTQQNATSMTAAKRSR